MAKYDIPRVILQMTKTVKTNLNDDDYQALSGIEGMTTSEKLKNAVKMALIKPIEDPAADRNGSEEKDREVIQRLQDELVQKNKEIDDWIDDTIDKKDRIEELERQLSEKPKVIHHFGDARIERCPDCGERNPRFAEKDETECENCGTSLGAKDTIKNVHSCPGCGLSDLPNSPTYSPTWRARLK